MEAETSTNISFAFNTYRILTRQKAATEVNLNPVDGNKEGRHEGECVETLQGETADLALSRSKGASKESEERQVQAGRKAATLPRTR
jgi:hypothetical protein